VAMDVPEAVREALAELTRRFALLCPSARWVRLAGAHITLKFIGHVPDEQAELISAALAEVRMAPLELRFAGLGFFPNARRPRVLWAGAEAGQALATLSADIEMALARLGIPRENREFKPHLTLARFDSRDALNDLRPAVEDQQRTEFGRTTIEHFHLYRSVLKQTGAEYTRLQSYPISARSAGE
jgi:2'-5' RNA ligase